MGERSLAQVAHDAYWRATSSVVTPWDEVQGMFKGAWAAAATACAQQEREATEAQRFLAQKFEARAAQAADEAAALRGQLAEAQERLRTVKEHEAYLEADTAKLSDALTRMRAECAAAQVARDEWAHKCRDAELRESAAHSVALETQRALEAARAETHETLLRALRVIEAVAGVRP